MFVADMGGALGAVTAGAQEVVVDPQSASEVIALLDETIAEIREQDVLAVRETSFGTLTTASQLGHHTELARQAIIEALVDLKTGLRIYADNVQQYRNDQLGTDDLVAAQNIAPIEAGVACVSGDVTAQNDPPAAQCTVPGGSDGR